MGILLLAATTHVNNGVNGMHSYARIKRTSFATLFLLLLSLSRPRKDADTTPRSSTSGSLTGPPGPMS